MFRRKRKPYDANPRLQRGIAAFIPFVHELNLSVTPEDVEEIVFVVLSFADREKLTPEQVLALVETTLKRRKSA